MVHQAQKSLQTIKVKAQTLVRSARLSLAKFPLQALTKLTSRITTETKYTLDRREESPPFRSVPRSAK